MTCCRTQLERLEVGLQHGPHQIPPLDPLPLLAIYHIRRSQVQDLGACGDSCQRSAYVIAGIRLEATGCDGLSYAIARRVKAAPLAAMISDAAHTGGRARGRDGLAKTRP